MITTHIYLHGCKDSNYDKGETLGLTGDALDNFAYACYEVKVAVEVDPATGNATIVAVDDKPLQGVVR